MPRKLKTAANGAATDLRAETAPPKPKAKRSTGPRRTQVRVPKAKKSTGEVTDEAIRLRAYFISQDRRRHGMSSDPHSDWIEARRQLLSEASAT